MKNNSYRIYWELKALLFLRSKTSGLGERSTNNTLFKLKKKTEKINNIFQELISVEKKAKYGDVLGTSHVFYEHYGIYCGKGTIIHYTMSEDGSFGEIRKTNMENFLNSSTTFFILDCEYKKPHKSLPIIYRTESIPNILKYFRDYLTKADVYSPEATVMRAESRIGEKNYDILDNNCEHFAIWCKTGLSESYQIKEFLEVVPREVIEVIKKKKLFPILFQQQ